MAYPDKVQLDAAARAIDKFWSDDTPARNYPFESTEGSYQQHCRDTARVAILAAQPQSVDAALLAAARILASLDEGPKRGRRFPTPEECEVARIAIGRAALASTEER